MHNETFYTTKDIKNFKIAIISDIHYYPEYKEKIFNKIIKQMKDNHPDYITVTGDILDSSGTTDLCRLENFFKSLASITKTFVVIGNHDEKKGHMHKWSNFHNEILINMLKSIDNLYFLNDNSITINNITFYGFNLSYHHYEVVDETYESFCEEIKNIHPNLSDSTYNIVLFHSPINIYKYIKANPNENIAKSDLILSGHMHNGCLPFIISHPLNKLFKTSRGLISPARTLFPKYAQGKIYDTPNGYIYEGITKLSKSTMFLHNFDSLFQKNVQFLTIKQKGKNN